MGLYSVPAVTDWPRLPVLHPLQLLLRRRWSFKKKGSHATLYIYIYSAQPPPATPFAALIQSFSLARPVRSYRTIFFAQPWLASPASHCPPILSVTLSSPRSAPASIYRVSNKPSLPSPFALYNLEERCSSRTQVFFFWICKFCARLIPYLTTVVKPRPRPLILLLNGPISVFWDFKTGNVFSPLYYVIVVFTNWLVRMWVVTQKNKHKLQEVDV